MAFKKPRPPCVGVVVVIATLLLLGSSIVWGHGDGPLAHRALQPSALQLGLLPLLTLSVSLAAGAVPLLSRVSSLGRMGGDPLVWALAGLLSFHLIALPPHLVHHISRPQAEAVNCPLLLLGSSAEHGSGQTVTPIEDPGFIGNVTAPGLPPVLSRPAPPIYGRSPPGLFV